MGRHANWAVELTPDSGAVRRGRGKCGRLGGPVGRPYICAVLSRGPLVHTLRQRRGGGGAPCACRAGARSGPGFSWVLLVHRGKLAPYPVCQAVSGTAVVWFDRQMRAGGCRPAWRRAWHAPAGVALGWSVRGACGRVAPMTAGEPLVLPTTQAKGWGSVRWWCRRKRSVTLLLPVLLHAAGFSACACLIRSRCGFPSACFPYNAYCFSRAGLGSWGPSASP